MRSLFEYRKRGRHRPSRPTTFHFSGFHHSFRVKDTAKDELHLEHLLYFFLQAVGLLLAFQSVVVTAAPEDDALAAVVPRSWLQSQASCLILSR